MIIPTKHTNFTESLLGFGSYILTKIESISSVDELWKKYQYDYSKKLYPSKHSFDNLLLVLVFFHSIGIIDERDGRIVKCD